MNARNRRLAPVLFTVGVLTCGAGAALILLLLAPTTAMEAASEYGKLQPDPTVAKWVRLIPSKATDICYIGDAECFFGNFELDNSDFLEWTRMQGWEIASIESSWEVRSVRADGSTEIVTLHDGYVFDGDGTDHGSRKSGRRVCFDGARQVVYCHFWSE